MAEPVETKPIKPLEAPEQAPAGKRSDIVPELDAEHERIKKDIDAHLKSFLEHAKGISEEDKKELQKKAADESISIFELQMGYKWLNAKPEEKYAKLSSVYLEYVSSKTKESFKVSTELDKNPRTKMFIGAAHLLPPNVTRIRVIDTKGEARIGTRGIQNGRLGYFDAKGYIPIFGGYQIDPLDISDANSDVAKKQFSAEQKHCEERIEELETSKKRELADDLPSTLDTLATAKKETLEEKGYKAAQVEIILKGKDAYEKTTQILAHNNIKADEVSAMQGARGFYNLKVEDLGWLEGKTLNEMGTENNKAVQMLQVLQNGGTLENVKIDGGYSLNFSQLPELLFLAKTEGRLKIVLDSIAMDKKAKGKENETISAQEIIAYMFEKGVSGLNSAEVQRLIQKNKKMQHLVDPQWGISAYMKDNWIKRGSAIKNIDPPTDADLNAGQDQEVVGYKCCAFTVSNYLNMTGQGFGNELSAPRLTMRLIKGGGKILPTLAEGERGDVIATKGSTEGSPENQITHVLMIRDVCHMPHGGTFSIIQDNSKVLGINFVVNNAADRKPLEKIITSMKSQLAGASPERIEEIVRSHGFTASDVKKITSALLYRQKFPNTIRVGSASSEYYSSHIYAIIRPNYKKESIVAKLDTLSSRYQKARKGRLTSHA